MKFTKILISLFLFSAFFLIPTSVVKADDASGDITVTVTNAAGTLSANSCTSIPLYGTNCNTLLNWTTTPATGAGNVMDGATIAATGLSGVSVPYAMYYGTHVFTLSNNGNGGISGLSVSVSASCLGEGDSTIWGGSNGCIPKPYLVTITVKTNGVVGTGGGSVTPGSTWANYGSTPTFTSSTNAGYTVSSTNACGGSLVGNVITTAQIVGNCSIDYNFTINPYLLTVINAGTGSGTVTSNPTGISCPGTCTKNYNYGTQVTLTAAATTGSTFEGWSGGGCSGTGNCVTYIAGATNITATFTLQTNLLTVNKTDPSGSATVTSSAPTGISCPGTCTKLINYGTGITINAPAVAGYYAKIDPTNGGCTATEGALGAAVSCTVSNMTYPITETVIYRRSQNLLTVTKVDPSASATVTSTTPTGISCPGTCTKLIDYGTGITINAPAVTGYYAKIDSGTGGCGVAEGALGAAVSCTVSNMTYSITETVTYRVSQNTLTVTKGGNGTGTVTLSPSGGSYNYGTVVTLTATPGGYVSSTDFGSSFSSWSGGGCSSAASASAVTCAVTITSATSVNANFAKYAVPSASTVSPSPVGFGVSPTASFTSTNGYYCHMLLDWTWGSNGGWDYSGAWGSATNISIPSTKLTATGSHVISTICYNSDWLIYGSWVNTNFTVDTIPAPVLKSTTPYGGTDMTGTVETRTGDQITLSWAAVAGATSCRLSGGSFGSALVNVQGGSQATTASDLTQTYTLSCTNITGQTGPTSSVTITTPPPVTLLTNTCRGDSLNTTVSWTLPTGYTTSLIRATRDSDGASMVYSDTYVGSSVSFDISPNTAYTFWIHTRNSSNNAYRNPAVYVYPNCARTHTLTIASPGTVSGTYSATGTYTLNYGATPTVTAEGWAGYTVAITGGCTATGADGVGASCTLPAMISNQTVTVTYTITQRTLTVTNNLAPGVIVTTNPVGSPTLSCGATCSSSYDYGTYVRVTAPDVTNYTATISGGCSVGPSAVNVGTYCDVKMDSSQAVTVTYNRPTNILTVASPAPGPGTITGSYTTSQPIAAVGNYNVPHGGDFTVTSNGWAGYTLSVSGACTATAAYEASLTCAITNMTSAKTVTFTYTIKPFTITPTPQGNCPVSPTSLTINYGSKATFTVTPNAGYTASVGGSCGVIHNGNTHETSAITAACTVSISCPINTYSLNYSVGAGGASLTGTASQSVNYGANGTAVTANPTTGYTFTGWTEKLIFKDGTPTFTPPAGVSSVEALVVGGGGGGGMDMGGGGGGGGVLYNSNYSVTPLSPYTVTVGRGGIGAPQANSFGQPGQHQYAIRATSGGNSNFGTITSIGGGYGGSSYVGYTPDYGVGGSGGSGGGASGYCTTGGSGSGTAGQGNPGGNGGNCYYSGGGGGAGGVGVSGTSVSHGGDGILNTILGTNYYWGAGGGGAGHSTGVGGNGGNGGGGGGGVWGGTPGSGAGGGLNSGTGGGNGGSAYVYTAFGGAGGANTGAGGGGGAHYYNRGGDGGSGAVIIKYVSSLAAARTDTTVKSDKILIANFQINSYGLTITKTGTGTVTGVSAPVQSNINCGVTCGPLSYTHGTVVTLTATPSAGWTFAGWSGGGCSGTGTCAVTMDAAKTVNANFTNTPPPVSNPLTPTNGSVVSVIAAGNTNGNVTFTSTTVTDVDGTTPQYYFRVATGTDAETGVVCNSGWQTSPSYTCNTGANYGLLYWHVYTYDGVNQTNPTVTWSFTNNAQPYGVSVSPSSGSYRRAKTFTSTYKDYNGGADITYNNNPPPNYVGYVHLLINNAGVNGNQTAFYGYYQPTSATAGNCYLFNSDDAGAWAAQGWKAVPAVLPWVTLNSCSHSYSGNDMTVTWNLDITNWNETGMGMYLYAVDKNGWSWGWSGSMGTISTGQILTVTNNDASKLVTVSPAGSSSISCGAACTSTFDYNTSVTVTAPAKTGYTVSLTGACTANGAVGAGATCAAFNMTSDKTVWVTYTIWPFTVTATDSAGGTITPALVRAVNYLADTTYVITPIAGYLASVSGTCGGTLTSVGIPVTSYTYKTSPITADCTVLPTYYSMGGTLSAAPTSCTIPLNANVCGTNPTLTWTITNPIGDTTAITANGISPITVSGQSGTHNTYDYVSYPSRLFHLYNNERDLATANVTSSCALGTSWIPGATPTVGAILTAGAGACKSDYVLTVTNNIPAFTVTASPSGSSSISCGATCTSTYNYGKLVTITAPAIAGYSVAMSNGCSNGPNAVGAGASCSVTMDAARTVAVVYSDGTPPSVCGAMTTTYTGDHFVNTNFTASATASTDTGSGIRGYQLWRSVDNTQTASVQVGTEQATPTLLVSGANLPTNNTYRYYSWRAFDNSGNQTICPDNYVRMDGINPIYNSTTFTGCNYESGNNCYVKNLTTFYVNISHTDNESGTATQYFELSKNGANRGTWDGATGNIKSYANPYGVSNGGYYTSFTDGPGMEGTGYMDIQNAQCIQAGNCNVTALGKWPVVAGSGASTMYGVTVYMYDQMWNGVGYTTTSKYVYLDNTAPSVPTPTDAGAYSAGTSLTFTGTASDAYSGIASCSAQIDVNNTDGASLAMGTTLVSANGSYTWASAVAGNTYYYRYVCDDNVGNNSGWSSWSDGIAINTVPTVTSPTATSITPTTATLGANVTSLGVPAAISERGVVYSSTISNPTTANSKAIAAGLTTGVYTVGVLSLAPSTLYHYRGYAINSSGTAYTSDATFTTAPATVTGLWCGASVPGNYNINLSWNAASTATSYQLYRGATKIYDGGLLLAADSGLLPATQYSYTIYASNASGQSAVSNTVSCTTANAITPAPDVKVTTYYVTGNDGPTETSSGGSITLSWGAVANATSCTLSGGTLGTITAAIAGGTQATTVSALTQTYTLNCTNSTSQSASDTVTVTVPPVPTGVGYTCSPTGVTGMTANVSWTAPSGYTAFYLRTYLVSPYTDMGSPGTQENYTGTSIGIPIAPNTAYSYWMHTRNANGAYSSAPTLSINCTRTHTLNIISLGNIVLPGYAITAPVNATYTLNYGVTPTVTAEGQLGNKASISTIAGLCAGPGAEATNVTCNVPAMTADQTVTVTYAIQTRTLTVNKTGTGTGTAGTSGSYNYNSVVTLTQSADASSTFAGWSGNDADCNDGSVTMNADKTCTATFNLKTSAVTIVSLGAVSGTYNDVLTPYSSTGTYSVLYNQRIYVSAQAWAGNTVTIRGAGCTGDGADSQPASCTSSAITSGPQTITVTYAVQTRGLTIPASGGNGAGTYGGHTAGSYNYNTDISITATPSAGSTFTKWVASGAALACNDTTTSPCAFKLTSIASVQAIYTLNPEILTVNKAGTGTGAVTGAGTYNYNDVAYPTATADANSFFAGWTIGCSGGASPTSVTMDAAKTCTATFTAVTVSVSATDPSPVTTPTSTVSFAYTPTTNTGTTQCQLLNNSSVLIAGYDYSQPNPIVYNGVPSTPGTYGYYIKCRNTTYTAVTGISSLITVTVNGVPTVDTPTATAITSTTATLGANVASLGYPASISERGVCLDRTSGHAAKGVGTCLPATGTSLGTYTVGAASLTAGATYYYRGYATNATGDGYTSESSFTTLNLPTVTTNPVTAINTITATCGGNTNSTGGAEVTVAGCVWNTTGTPVYIQDGPNQTTAGWGTPGNWTNAMTGLIQGTTYYVRAYATNSVGIKYGDETSFTTLGVPTLDTPTATAIAPTTATLGATVRTLGNPASISARGVCYSSTSSNPTTPCATATLSQTVPSSFTVNVGSLTPGTLYHYRGFATNTTGIGYTSDATFTTPAVSVTVTASDPTTYNTIPSGIVTVFFTSTTNTSTTQCELLDNVKTLEVTTWAGSNPTSISFTANATPNSYGYYVRCRNTTYTGTTGDSIAMVTVNVNAVPTVISPTVTSVTSTTATLGANVTSLGYPAALSARGVCLTRTLGQATKELALTCLVASGTGLGTYTVGAASLTAGATYFYSGYATNAIGTGYSSEGSFTTLALPTITTNPVTAINQTTATCGGNTVSNGGATVDVAGCVWNTTGTPTSAIYIQDGPNQTTAGWGTPGNWTNAMTGLTPSTTYYVRAYAKNSEGTAYGNETSFTTLGVPTLDTPTSASITPTTATLGATVRTLGNPASISARGVCYGQSLNPSISDTCGTATLSQTVPSVFTVAVTTLTPGTLYHYRGYARNTTGYGYTSDATFTTQINLTIVSPGNISGTYSAPGTYAVNYGATPTVTAEGWAGNTMTIIGGGCNSSGAEGVTTSCTLPAMTASATVTVQYTATTRNLTITRAGTGAGTVTGVSNPVQTNIACGSTCALPYTYGTTVTLTATPTVTIPTSGSVFAGWSGEGCSGVGTCVVAITTVRNVTATFNLMTGTLLLSPTTCNIPANSNGCNATTLTWTTTNPIATASAVTASLVTVGTKNYPAVNATSGTGNGTDSTSFLVPHGSRIFYLYNNSIQLATSTITASCITGTTWDAAATPTAGPITGAGAVGACISPGGWITATPNPCNIALGASSCTTNLTWGTTNPIGVSAVTTDPSNTSVAVGNDSGSGFVSGSKTYSITPPGGGARTFYLYNNSLLRNQVTVPAPTCISGAWIGGVCVDLPTVTTTQPTAAGQYAGNGGGNTIANGGSTVTAAGIVWSTSSNPTTASKLGITTTGWDIGGPWAPLPSPTMPNLTINTLYHVRAYATNIAGTVYGDDLTFTTNPAVVPTVTTTTPVTSITTNSAIGGGNVTSNGGATITTSGLAWSTSSNPTYIQDGPNQTTDGWKDSGDWTSNMNGLMYDTDYHVRAYAINGAGISYGADVTFKTSPVPTTGNIHSVDCRIDPGASVCDTKLSWDTISPISGFISDIYLGVTKITSGNYQLLPPGFTQSIPYKEYPSVNTFTLKHAGKTLSSVTASAICSQIPTATYWNGSICHSTVVKRLDNQIIGPDGSVQDCTPPLVANPDTNTCVVQLVCPSNKVLVKFDNSCQDKLLCSSSLVYVSYYNTCQNKVDCTINSLPPIRDVYTNTCITAADCQPPKTVTINNTCSSNSTFIYSEN